MLCAVCYVLCYLPHYAVLSGRCSILLSLPNLLAAKYCKIRRQYLPAVGSVSSMYMSIAPLRRCHTLGCTLFFTPCTQLVPLRFWCAPCSLPVSLYFNGSLQVLCAVIIDGSVLVWIVPSLHVLLSFPLVEPVVHVALFFSLLINCMERVLHTDDNHYAITY